MHCVHSETLMHKRRGEKLKKKKQLRVSLCTVHSETLMHKRRGESYSTFPTHFRVFYNFKQKNIKILMKVGCIALG